MQIRCCPFFVSTGEPQYLHCLKYPDHQSLYNITRRNSQWWCMTAFGEDSVLSQIRYSQLMYEPFAGVFKFRSFNVYIETGRSLRSRMNDHRLAIKKEGQSFLHRHFHQPNHSVDDMKVQILEKVYQSSENPILITSFCRTSIVSLTNNLDEKDYMKKAL